MQTATVTLTKTKQTHGNDSVWSVQMLLSLIFSHSRVPSIKTFIVPPSPASALQKYTIFYLYRPRRPKAPIGATYGNTGEFGW